MDKREFEQMLMDYLASESLVLTPVNVAFALRLDTGDVAGFLAALAGDGKLILEGGEGMAASYRVPGKQFAGPKPGDVSVTRAKSSACFYHALSNFFFPGLGSLLYLKPFGFLPPLVLIGISITIAILLGDWFKLFAILPIPLAWIWSVVYGVLLYFSDPWSAKGK